MKKAFVFTILAVLATFVSCNKSEIGSQAPAEGYRYEFAVNEESALAEDMTKATLDNSGVTWVAGDRVGMFLDGYTGYAEINLENTPRTVILYSPEIIPANSYAYAYYPNASNSDKTAVKIALSNVQQGGVDAAMPMVGVPFKVLEEAEAKSRPNGTINFLNLGSIICFKVYSSKADYLSETIQYISLEASDASIAGTASIDLTKVNATDASTLAFDITENGSNTVKVNQEATVASAKTDASSIYMVLAPGQFGGTITVGTDAATYTWTLPEMTFNRNGLKTFNMDLKNANRSGVVEVVKTLPYEEAFTVNQGDFSIENVTLPEGQTSIWSFDSSYGAKVTSYINKVNYASESWLVSPQIDLTDVKAAELSFDQCVNKFMADGDGSLWIKVVGDDEFTQIPNTYPALSGTWSSFEPFTFDLSDYVGKKVVFAFKYVSTSEAAGTWEIKNFKVEEIVYTTEFTIAMETLSVQVGKTKKNVVSVNSGAAISFVSNDETIATVDEDGNVTGIAEGETTISVSVPAFNNYPAAESQYAVTVIPAATEKDFTWDLSVASYATATAETVVWSNDNVSMESAKGTSSTAPNNYIPPTKTSTRLYSGNNLTITPKGTCEITKIEFKATSTNYATSLKGSTWTNADVEVTDDVVTVSPLDGTSAIIAAVGGTCGLTAVKVYYTGGVDIVETEYTITVNEATSGTVTASAEKAIKGTEITLTVTPNDGYQLETLTVLDADNNAVAVNNFKFSMPASNVTVSATFKENESGSYVLNPIAGSNNGYANNCDVTIDGITWNVEGNSQQIPWRIGGKSLSNVDRAIYSKTALEMDVERIEITHGAASGVTVNSMTIIVASDAGFTNVVSELTPEFAVNSTIAINRPASADWSGCYFKIVYNLTVTSTSNKFLEFTKAVFSGN